MLMDFPNQNVRRVNYIHQFCRDLSQKLFTIGQVQYLFPKASTAPDRSPLLTKLERINPS
jgi:hypothetical protein